MAKHINKNNKKHYRKYLLSSVFLVFIVYLFSLFRPWQPFDERLFYNETLFPIPQKYDEILEIIRNFVINSHLESMNTFFSNHLTIRSDPVAWSILVFIFYLFKKNAFLFHLFQLFIHLVSTIFAWLIFHRLGQIIINRDHEIKNHRYHYAAISLFTLIWALHSTNTEAILLVTNWNAVLIYAFCLGFIFYEVNKISKAKSGLKGASTIIISILFFLLMFLVEYGYTMPLILFFIIFPLTYKQNHSVKNSFFVSLKQIIPYLIGLFAFVLFSLAKSNSALISLFNTYPSSFYFFIERNFWLTPQIFIHLLKLILFPKTLSTYQSNLINISNSLYEPYAVFCALLYILILVIPFLLFLILRKKDYGYLFLLFYPFYFALFPFLHAIAPTYCLAADRYCYFPSFLFMFFVFALCIQFIRESSYKKTIVILCTILFLLTTRTLFRTLEWMNPSKLYESAIKVEKNPLYKAQKLIIFADYVGSKGNQSLMEESLIKSLQELSRAIKQFKKLSVKYKDQPLTLKIYGLDFESLILKAAYTIAFVKNDNYLEHPKIILDFFEPYIKDKLNIAGINQICLYASLLSKDGEKEKAKEILEYGYKKFPYSADIMFSLVNFYFEGEKNLDKAYEILKHAYNYFPNQPRTLYNLLKYYEKKNDLQNQAKFAYLLGLREHSVESYQKAVQIYLALNDLNMSNKTLKKLIRLKSNDPLTLLFVSRYLDLSGKRSKILEILNNAYYFSHAQGERQNIQVTKSILISLVTVNAHKGDLGSAKKYISEFEQMKNLSTEDRNQISLLKKLMKEKENLGI